jgi:hypothetical protein
LSVGMMARLLTAGQRGARASAVVATVVTFGSGGDVSDAVDNLAVGYTGGLATAPFSQSGAGLFLAGFGGSSYGQLATTGEIDWGRSVWNGAITTIAGPFSSSVTKEIAPAMTKEIAPAMMASYQALFGDLLYLGLTDDPGETSVP